MHVPKTTLSTIFTTPATTTTLDYVINEIPDEKPSKELIFDIEHLLRTELQKIMVNPKPMVEPKSPPVSIGTQINIQNLNIDMGAKMESEEQQCGVEDREAPSGLFLGNGHDIVLDYEKLSNIVQNFYEGADKSADAEKKRKKNSPMLIKFFE